jgi:hypothetical protein
MNNAKWLETLDIDGLSMDGFFCEPFDCTTECIDPAPPDEIDAFMRWCAFPYWHEHYNYHEKTE